MKKVKIVDTKEFIPIAKPVLGEKEALATHRPILSGWVTQGPEVEAFEDEFAAFVGAKHACAVSNCTVALHLALLTVGVKPGDEVITVSHSFIATANAVRYCGAKPVFVDIQLETFNMDPTLIERVITERTSAILCVHQLGMPCDLKGVMTIAKKYNIPVVEDAACATGSEILWDGKWEHIGKPHGDIACFSFHPRKVITTGDGGMLTTSNQEFDSQFRLLRQHGMSVPDTVRHESKQVIFESYTTLGYNYRMTDIQGSIGREQVKRLPEIILRRRKLAARYHEELAVNSDITLPIEPEWARSNWQSYCIRLSEKYDQWCVMQRMLDEGIATRRGVQCAHREPTFPYNEWTCGIREGECDCKENSCSRLKKCEIAQDYGLVIPLYYQMTEEDQDRVIVVLKKTCSLFIDPML